MPRKKGGLGRGLAELLGEGFPEQKRPGRPGDAERDEARFAAVEAESTIPGEAPGQVPGQVPGAIPGQAPGAVAGAAPGTGEHGASAIVEISVTAIRPNPRQPRRSMDREGLEELARSIESSGIVQPIIVRPLADGYELIAGERRWRAAQMAGFSVVPAILRSASDTESLEISLVENVIRQQLNPVDEALALHVLMEDLGVTQEGLSARVGKSRPAIANKLRLLELPGEVQEMLAEGALSEGHGRALLALKSRGDQLRLARRAAEKGLSVREVEAAVKKAKEPGAKKTPSESVPEELAAEAREIVYETLEVVPRIRVGARGGRLEIPFRGEAELRDLLARLRRTS
ncbi:MAG: hypothetical protein Kow00129_08720 [Thermoleophilia bacterium]